MKKAWLMTAVAGCLLYANAATADDSGWYLTRKSPYEANMRLENRSSDIRDLITDCTERSISLSCHRAGVWLVKHKDTQRGISYIANACKLGRGYSCRLVGEYYLRGATRYEGKTVGEKQKADFDKNAKLAKDYFIQGCFRHDKKSCGYAINPPKAPALKE